MFRRSRDDAWGRSMLYMVDDERIKRVKVQYGHRVQFAREKKLGGYDMIQSGVWRCGYDMIQLGGSGDQCLKVGGEGGGGSRAAVRWARWPFNQFPVAGFGVERERVERCKGRGA